jgi:hypothetical protein
LGELTVSVSGDVGIRAKNIALADDSAFSTGEFDKIAEQRSRTPGSARALSTDFHDAWAD